MGAGRTSLLAGPVPALRLLGPVNQFSDLGRTGTSAWSQAGRDGAQRRRKQQRSANGSQRPRGGKAKSSKETSARLFDAGRRSGHGVRCCTRTVGRGGQYPV